MKALVVEFVAISCLILGVECIFEDLLNAPSGLELFTRFIGAPANSFATPSNTSGLLSSDPNDVNFVLYSDLGKPGQVIQYGNLESLENSSYDTTKPVKILLHGFIQNGTTNFPLKLKNAYLQTNGDAYNIIVVDWGKLATPTIDLPLSLTLYALAAGNVRPAGIRAGEFLAWLHDQAGLDTEDMHIIGHSLGAHAAGWAGVMVQNLTGKRAARLTALDPAGPLFETGITLRKMKSTDADFVDVYHTGSGGLGMLRDTGKLDFWVNNGGPIQPGCLPDLGGFCSHWRSFEYFGETVLNGTQKSAPSCACASRLKFLLRKECCDQRLSSGTNASPSSSGTYFVSYTATQKR